MTNVDKLPTLGPLESVAVLGLRGEFREAYNTEFQVGLSISVMKNRATRHKNLQLKIENLHVKVLPPAHLNSNPAFFKPSCASQAVKTIRTSAYHSFQDD
ncbi:hypothetical protein [Absidia glauca]|uniref:Uncharacterized protein n=1 Tax=Absidia glauca TaxID=4829 RepID=A0A168PG99_ABSGL|nr:hypothetical protein [Absidia glauca]